MGFHRRLDSMLKPAGVRIRRKAQQHRVVVDRLARMARAFGIDAHLGLRQRTGLLGIRVPVGRGVCSLHRLLPDLRNLPGRPSLIDHADVQPPQRAFAHQLHRGYRTASQSIEICFRADAVQFQYGGHGVAQRLLRGAVGR